LEFSLILNAYLPPLDIKYWPVKFLYVSRPTMMEYMVGQSQVLLWTKCNETWLLSVFICCLMSFLKIKCDLVCRCDKLCVCSCVWGTCMYMIYINLKCTVHPYVVGLSGTTHRLVLQVKLSLKQRLFQKMIHTIFFVVTCLSFAFE